MGKGSSGVFCQADSAVTGIIAQVMGDKPDFLGKRKNPVESKTSDRMEQYEGFLGYQYFLLRRFWASSREISPELHFAMICTSLSLSL